MTASPDSLRATAERLIGLAGRAQVHWPETFRYQEGGDAYTHIIRYDHPEYPNCFVTQFGQRTDGSSETIARLWAQCSPEDITALAQAYLALTREKA
jgi:hypothetical protein